MSADWTALVRSGAGLRAKGGHEIGDGHADLAHRVALADRHLLVVERYEVDRHAERRSDLVLTAVSPADRLRLIVRGHERRPDLRPHLARERHKALVLRQRKDGHFVRGEMRTEAEHNARALLDGFLVVRGAEDRVRRRSAPTDVSTTCGMNRSFATSSKYSRFLPENSEWRRR